MPEPTASTSSNDASPTPPQPPGSDSGETPRRYLERAASLAGVVEAEAKASEEARTLSPKTVDALREADLLVAFLPRELGGDELPAAALAAIVEEVSRQDGSAGWCLGMNGFISGICAASLRDAGLERVFGDRSPARTWIAGGFPPQGRADREGEGWRVQGHFRFGSGCRHADFMCCTVIEFADDAPVMDGAIPLMRTFVVPQADVRIVDNWHVAGLEGTGSCDYHLDDQWFHDDVSFVSSSPSPHRGAALYGLPLLSIAGASHAGFALGVGRRALEEIAAHATWRQRLGSSTPLASRSSFQQGFARAHTRMRAARALVTESLDALSRACDSGSPADFSQRANASSSTTFAYEAALDAAAFACRAAGAAALFRDNRLQRCLRDIQAGSQHIVASDESWERFAQVWLGVGEPSMV